MERQKPITWWLIYRELLSGGGDGHTSPPSGCCTDRSCLGKQRSPSWFSTIQQITVKKNKKWQPRWQYQFLFLLFWWFGEWERKRCLPMVYMQSKNRHHIHNDNILKQPRDSCLLHTSCFEDQSSHIHANTLTDQHPPTTDHWGAGGAPGRV